MDVTQAWKLKEMEQENTRLKKLVADLSLDNAILKEVPASTKGGADLAHRRVNSPSETT